MTSDGRDLGDVPGRSRAELGVEAAKLGLSAIPFFGGTAAEMLAFIAGPSLERRRVEWFEQIGKAVQELRDRLEDFDPRALQENEAFVTTVLATSILALKTHQAEKLESFRHAIVNSVLSGAPDEYEQMTFLRYVDELTPLHMRLLTLLDDPRGWFDRHGIAKPNFMSGGIAAILDPGMPELRGARKDQVLTDLANRGLTVGTGPGVASADSVWSSHTSTLGRAFLAFITAPPQGSAAEHI